ncbi:bifunctional RNase H/acid phosphatase [Streptomyces sp. 4N509B]|uniref:bifunctional RNase H/acid phosphatase n=1 Tax=Streptomyces sp. 4N509B TaxID=3457413 RepID=UPI003FD50FAC
MSRSFIIEADGGSRGNPGPAGYGAVVRDAATGEPLAETAASLGMATNNVAEYQGLVAGLKAARALDPDARVRVRMDSKLVVEQMSGRWRIKHPDLRPLAQEAARVFPAGAVSYEWVPRERNRHADRLANEAMDAARRGETWRPSRSTTTAGGASAGDTAARDAAGGGADGADGAPEAGAGAGVGPGRRAADARQAEERPAVGWRPPSGAPTTFLLLRHGETALTPFKRFSGSGGSDPELSPTGREQADAVARRLAGPGGPRIDAIVSSPLLRCRQTAEASAARLGLEIRYDEGWREVDFGAWEGLSFAEVRDRHPRDLDAWLASPDAQPSGGGESFTELTRRVAVARDKAIARHPGRTLLVVTHVSPVKTLLRLALDAPAVSMFRMELSPASLCEVAYYPDGNAMVHRVNDTGS